MSRAWLSLGMAFSTGITWKPSPAPPGGTMWEMVVRGR